MCVCVGAWCTWAVLAVQQGGHTHALHTKQCWDVGVWHGAVDNRWAEKHADRQVGRQYCCQGPWSLLVRSNNKPEHRHTQTPLQLCTREAQERRRKRPLCSADISNQRGRQPNFLRIDLLLLSLPAPVTRASSSVGCCTACVAPGPPPRARCTAEWCSPSTAAAAANQETAAAARRTPKGRRQRHAERSSSGAAVLGKLAERLCHPCRPVGSCT